MNRKQIAQLVEQLDHPDAAHQREIMDKLVALGAPAVETLTANLRLAEPRARKALVRVLGEIGSDAALLPLMRFVWDTRDAVGESDARGLAMKAIASIAGPEHARKVFQFLLDVNDDEDPFVRGYAAEAMGKFGDRRARPILQEMARDSEEFVRERAQKALLRLADAPGESLKQDLDDQELLKQVRSARGGEKEFYVNELRSRDNAFELASTLVRDGGRLAMTGLNILQSLGDPRAREVAVAFYPSATSAAHRAVCLRIIAEHIDGDATEEESEIVKLAFYDTDRFVELAAVEAAAVTGDPELIRRAVNTCTDRDSMLAAGAARSLSRGLRPEHRRILPEIRGAFDIIHRRRLQNETEDHIRAEAYLLRAAKRLIEGGGFGTTQVQELGLKALDQADEHHPIVVTALELLSSTTPPEGYPEDRRWPESLTANLFPLLRHPDRDVREHTLDVLSRGAPLGMDRMVDALEKLLYDREPGMVENVIELLGRTQSVRAKKLLEDLTEEPNENIRIAAEAALRRIRNADAFIDAEFE